MVWALDKKFQLLCIFLWEHGNVVYKTSSLLYWWILIFHCSPFQKWGEKWGQVCNIKIFEKRRHPFTKGTQCIVKKKWKNEWLNKMNMVRWSSIYRAINIHFETNQYTSNIDLFKRDISVALQLQSCPQSSPHFWNGLCGWPWLWIFHSWMLRFQISELQLKPSNHLQ